MDWFRYIDDYCERLTPGFWGEPLNALSNIAFVIAAAAAAVSLRHCRATNGRPAVWVLTALVAAIGIGSFAFHTFAQLWAMLADVIPISVFIYAYLGYALRRYLHAGWPATLITIVAFIAGSFGLDHVVPAHFLNGSVGYLPAVFALFAVSAALYRNAHTAAVPLSAAGLLLCLSLVFRTVDAALCTVWPLGTHFIWHCLNAILLYLLLRLAVDDLARRQ